MRQETGTPERRRFWVRFVVYVLLAAASLGGAMMLVGGMHRPEGPEVAYFQAGVYLPVTAVLLVSGGWVFYREYARQHRSYRGDAILISAVGLVYLLSYGALWLCYGALQAPFEEEAYRAVNLCIALLSTLPVPFTIRLATLIPARGSVLSTAERRVAFAVLFLLIGSMIVATACGGLWAMLSLS